MEDDTGVTQTLGRRLAARLRRDILSGALAPGAPIKERDNALRLGVSRTPLREAIRLLADEGLVILRPARSPVVADPSLGEVTDNLVVMIALEVLSGRLACAAAGAADLDRVAECYAAMQADGSGSYTPQFFEMDMDFHRAIVAASHNAPLIRTHAEYVGRLFRARYLSASARGERDRVLAEHGAICDGLLVRDAAATEAAIAAHLDNLTRHIARAFGDGRRHRP